MTELSPFRTPGGALARQANARGDREALAFPETGTRLTYAGWHEAATALARAILDRGFRPGDRVGLLAESRIEWPVVQMAIAMAGCVLVPLNTHYRRDDLAYALGHSRPRGLFLSRAFRGNPYLENVRAVRDAVPSLETLVGLDGGEADCAGYAELFEAGRHSRTALPEVDPDSVGSLQYTSGTTGFPKGALLTHSGMMANAWGISGTAPGFRRRPLDLDHPALPLRRLHHVHPGHGAARVGLYRGFELRSGGDVPDRGGGALHHAVGRADLLRGDARPPGPRWPRPVQPPRRHLRRRRHRPGVAGALRRGLPDPGRRPGLRPDRGEHADRAGPLRGARRFETCGPPLPGAAVRIADAVTGAPLPSGEIGQIETAGPMVMRGYFDNPEATDETIGTDGWMRTGDLGYLTADGNVVVAGGRLRDMIIRGGENIYPVEIENLLRTHPAVADIAVFGMPDDYYGEIVAAAVMGGEALTPDALGRFCAGRIARFKVPARYFRVESFPLTASGKIRKTELRDMAGAGALETL